MEKIVVENLTKIFGHHPERGIEMLEKGMTKDQIFKETKLSVGVNRASFVVNQGEIVVVMGLSGSGKSTLVRCINRLIEPTAGEVYIDGQAITGLNTKELREVRLRKMGMVFQNFALFPHRTVAQNTEYGLEIQGVAPAERREKAIKALSQVGLAGQEDSYPRQLSGGMQQRVGLARALALDPDILLMDEAFSALDPLIRSDMQDELIQLQETMHKTILFISHDLDEALKIGDRIILMKDGVIVQDGTAEEILTNPANENVERFVENVDISKVLTAESVMRKSSAVAYITTDGPKAALRKMKNHGLSHIFVLNKDHVMQGILAAEDAIAAAERGEKDIGGLIRRDITTVGLDSPATELMNILKDLPYPLAVVNENNKLKGVIVRGTLLGALAERGRGSDDANA